MNLFLYKSMVAIVLIVGLLYIHKNYLYRLWTQPKPGVVIILNGPSAAGKSSLQKSLQRLAPVPFLSVGIDNFFNDLFPDEHGKLGVNAEADFGNDLRWVTLQDNLVYLHVGPQGQKVIDGMHKAIAAYAKAGNNVVVDYIMYEQVWMQNFLHELQGCPVYMIGVTVPLDVCKAREQARSTSPIGHAGSHYDTVHVGNNYDFLLDNSQGTADEGAIKILDFIKNNRR